MDFGPRQGVQSACPGRGQVRSDIDTPRPSLLPMAREAGKIAFRYGFVERVRAVPGVLAA